MYLDHKAPTITVHPASREAKVGTNVVFTCTPNTSGTTTFAWKKDGVLLKEETSSKLTIININSADAGIYTCETTVFGLVTKSGFAALKVICKSNHYYI